MRSPYTAQNPHIALKGKVSLLLTIQETKLPLGILYPDLTETVEEQRLNDGFVIWEWRFALSG